MIFIYENSYMKLPTFTCEMDSICEISFFICELYNFIYDSIFIYENSYMKLPNFTCEMDFIYEISFFICELYISNSYMT